MYTTTKKFKIIDIHGTYFSGVDTRGIRGVTLEGLEGVEVLGGTRLRRVPLVVDILLGVLVPKLFIVISILEVELGGDWGLGGRHEGGSGGHKGNGDNRLHL